MSNFQSYQAMPQEATIEAPHATPTVRVNPQTLSVSVQDGVTTETTRGQSSARVADINPHAGTDGIFSTAQNPGGLPVYAIQDSTLLTINGIQATAASWHKQGMIGKDPQGEYTETPDEAPAEQQEAPEDAELGYFPPHEQDMAAINASLETVDQGHLDGLASVGIGAAVGKVDAGNLLSKFTQVSGLAGDEAAAKLEVLQTRYTHQASQALQKAGIAAADVAMVFEWARKTHQGELQETVTKQLHYADCSGWRKLAQQFMSSHAPSVEAMQAAGIPVRKSHHKAGEFECYINKPGAGWMSPTAAARAGLL